MATIEFDDVKYHVEMISTAPIQLVGGSRQESTAFTKFVSALASLDGTLPPQQLQVFPEDGDIKYRMTLADARVYRALLHLDPTSHALHTRSITQTSFFTLPELLAHNPVVETCLGLLAESVTNIEVIWT